MIWLLILPILFSLGVFVLGVHLISAGLESSSDNFGIGMMFRLIGTVLVATSALAAGSIVLVLAKEIPR